VGELSTEAGRSSGPGNQIPRTITMTTAKERNYDGPFKELLTELASLIDWLQREHDKSYVKAGDNKVYAFGGDGFVVVLDELLWDGLIELITPKGGVSIKPGDDGRIEVTSAVEGEAAQKQLLRDAIDGIRKYYENRYWSTPATAS
jgi:hypothetical protein